MQGHQAYVARVETRASTYIIHIYFLPTKYFSYHILRSNVVDFESLHLGKLCKMWVNVG